MEVRGKIREVSTTKARVRNGRNAIIGMESKDKGGRERRERTHDTQGRALLREVLLGLAVSWTGILGL